jgi:hypothetical protein
MFARNHFDMQLAELERGWEILGGAERYLALAKGLIPLGTPSF